MPADPDFELLHTMLADAEQADELYRPTRFWRPCSEQIVADLQTLGAHGFRRHPSALRFFVPVFRRASPLQRALASVFCLCRAPVAATRADYR